jgi:uncharacterized membrane protein (DUF485 family)
MKTATTANRYALAGWASIGSAGLTLAMLGLSLTFDLTKVVENRGQFAPSMWPARQVLLVIALDAFSWVLGIYAFVRFRDLLRERYDFHAIDQLIWIVIVAGLLVAVASHGQRLLVEPTVANAVTGVAIAVILGILNGVIGIVFATRLLRINGNLNGYKKPLAYVYLAASICFMLVLSALVGIVLLCTFNVILALVFFRGDDLEELEVV